MRDSKVCSLVTAMLLSASPLAGSALLAVALLSANAALAGDQPVNSPAVAKRALTATPEQISKWVAQLESDSFIERSEATESLIAANFAAVAPLLKGVGAGPESAQRAVYIFGELALSEDAKTEDAARAALEEIVDKGPTSAAPKAADTLQSLNAIRQQRAVAQLRHWGARIDESFLPYLPFQGEPMMSLEIGEEYKGGEAGLAQLKWLTEINQIVLIGSQVNDSWLEHVKTMTNLECVVLKRANITNAGVEKLTALSKLRMLRVLYSPISDDSVKSLGSFAAAKELHLYGTKITPEGVKSLNKALPDATVDFRRGGFLGVGCMPNPAGCMISQVQPKSAAEKAGLFTGDVIVKYNDKPVPDFKALTSLIGENQGRDTITLSVLREGEPRDVKVTLGEWD